METIIPEIQTNQVVPFQQSTPAGCVSLSLANIFNNARFIEGIENLKRGERCIDANLKLMKFEPYCYLEPVFVTNHLAAYPRLLDPLIIEHKIRAEEPNITEEHMMPFIMSIFKPADDRMPFDRYHSVAVFQDMGSEFYYVVDSLQIRVKKMYVTQLIAYHHIISIESFGMWEHPDPSNTMFIHKSALTHIFK